MSSYGRDGARGPDRVPARALVHCPVSSGPTFGTDVTREKLSHGWVSNLGDTALMSLVK